MKNDIIEESKSWIKYFYFNNSWIDNPKFKINGREPEEDLICFMRDLFELFLESDIFNNCTKIWLLSHENSITSALEMYNSQHTELDKININTGKSKIQYDKKKINRYYNPDMLFNVMHYPEKYLNDSLSILRTLQLEYFNDKEYREAMVIKVPKNFINTNIDDFSWVKLTEFIERYSVEKREKITKGKDSEFTANILGYYNYLISGKRLNTMEKERLEVIRHLLGIGG